MCLGGDNRGMVHSARPDLPAPVAAAVKVFGSELRVTIVGYLVEHGPATRGEISAGIGAVAKTVQFHLQALESTGVVRTDPPPGTPRSGQWLRYRADPTRLAELHAALGAHLGTTR